MGELQQSQRFGETQYGHVFLDDWICRFSDVFRGSVSQSVGVVSYLENGQLVLSCDQP